jgi:cyclohexyl-isocyanide hydratase
MTDAPIDRRALLALAGLAGVAATLPALAQQRPDAPRILMLVHPRMVALDLIGPLTVFSILRCPVQLAWKDKSPVSTDVGLPVAATHTFAESWPDPTVLFVPGGLGGTIDCMRDADLLAYLASRGERAAWVTSVCTGSLALAAAGLLKGYAATSHWAVADLLPLMGARNTEGRVVSDRNRITGGGVTAGIDFGLSLAATLLGEEVARRAQLVMEYAPQPPFRNGTPAEAGAERVAELRQARRGMDGEARLAAQEAGRRLGIAPT